MTQAILNRMAILLFKLSIISSHYTIPTHCPPYYKSRIHSAHIHPLEMSLHNRPMHHYWLGTLPAKCCTYVDLLVLVRPPMDTSQWWITYNQFNAYEANGLYGQRIHIAPLAEMVIVQFSAYPGHSDETATLFSHAFEAIANHLI